MTLDDICVSLHFIKNLCPHDVDILKKYLKDWALNKKYITENDDLEIFRFNRKFASSLC